MPDLNSLRTKVSSLPRDAQVTQRVANILKANLGQSFSPDASPAMGVAESPGAYGSEEGAAAEAGPDDEEMTRIQPTKSTRDEPSESKAVVYSKSKKKVILRQG